MGKMRNKVLVERSEGKGQLGSCGNRWEDNSRNGSYKNMFGR
jgi:hypothetical protein